MTIVASWFNNERPDYPSIWTACDTKVLFERGGTLQASKIFDLNIVCKDISGNPGYIHFRSTLTYSYAGSTLLAIHTYATLNTILSNLGGGNHQIPLRPDCYSIVNTATLVLKNHNESIRTEAQVIIAGICPKSNRLFIAKISTGIDSDEITTDYSIEFNDSDTLKFVLIGSHLKEIKERINTHVSKEHLSRHSYWRSPLTILTELVSKNSFIEIGGNLQIATLDSYWGNQLMSVSPDIALDGTTELKYQNIKLEDIVGKYVGECFIAIGGMIVDLDSLDAYIKSRWPDLNKR